MENAADDELTDWDKIALCNRPRQNIVATRLNWARLAPFYYAARSYIFTGNKISRHFKIVENSPYGKCMWWRTYRLGRNCTVFL